MYDTYAQELQRAAQEMAVTLMQLQDRIGTLHDMSVNEYEPEPCSYAVNELILGHNLGSSSVGPRTVGTQLLFALALAEDIAWQMHGQAAELDRNPPASRNDFDWSQED